MKNQTVSLSPPGMNIQLLPNDNSYIIRGTGPEGYIDRAILKDDPECEQKIRKVITSMYEYQHAQIEEFISGFPSVVNSQYGNLTAAIDDEFQPEAE